MKKFYEEPIMEVRNYVLPVNSSVMTSDPDLGDGDDFDPLNPKSNGGEKSNYFN